MKATLIHNPTAGFENPTQEELTRLLSQEGYKINYVNSEKDDLRKALQDPCDLVIVAGGDGTIAKIAGLLVGKKTPMGILPVGTANNIASTLQGLDLPQPGNTKWNPTRGLPFDVGVATENGKKSYFFESSGFGLLASSIAEGTKRGKGRNFKNRNEKVGFGLEVLEKLLPNAPATYYEIKLDGKDYSGKYIMVEIMNIRAIGPNIALAPDAHPGDGLFDVVLLGDEGRPSFAQYLHQRNGSKDARFENKAYKASSITIRSEQPDFHIDDELMEASTGNLSFTLEAGQLEFAWIY